MPVGGRAFCFEKKINWKQAEKSYELFWVFKNPALTQTNLADKL